MNIPLLCLVSFLCASPTAQIVKHQNNFDYRKARYVENCNPPATPVPACRDYGLAINVFEKHLHEATWFGDPTLKSPRVGAMPLQLKQLDADEKALGAVAFGGVK